jgi:hypothetical protein
MRPTLCDIMQDTYRRVQKTVKIAPVLDGMHQVQYGRVAGHCQYGSQYYFDIMTVTLDTELTTHYTGTKSIRDRSSIRYLYTKINYNTATQIFATMRIFSENAVKYLTNIVLIYF